MFFESGEVFEVAWLKVLVRNIGLVIAGACFGVDSSPNSFSILPVYC